MVDLTPITFIIILEHLLMAAVITFFLHSGYRELKEHRNNKLNRVMADANDLKKINDNLGHQKGDELITQIASCLKQVIKNDGNCYRTGGDEFVIVVSGGDYNKGISIKQAIHEELKQANEILDIPFQISTSVGWVCAKPDEKLLLEEYVKQADKVMYQEKKKTI